MTVVVILASLPLLVSTIKHCLKYEWHLGNIDRHSIVSMAVREMEAMPQLDTWHSRVKKIKNLLGISGVHGTKDSVSKFLGNKLKGTFDRFWLDQINVTKLDCNGVDHNKLRFYKTLKGSFTQEPYVTNIKKILES